jgi:tetratricopeptide (TPR) repeat protein
LKRKSQHALKLRGKVLSSLGQFYAFKRNKEKAIEYFEEALKEFANDDIQRSITLSYLMHCAIDMKDTALFKKYEKEYFKFSDINRQFDFILEDNKKENCDFKLYAYVKALRKMYGKNIDAELLKRICETDYKKYGFSSDHHPWELIYKQIANIYYMMGYANEGDKFLDKSLGCLKNVDFTIKVINYDSRLEAAVYKKDIKNCRKYLKEMKEVISNNSSANEYFNDAFAGDIDSFTEDTRIINYANGVINKFTFMYE